MGGDIFDNLTGFKFIGKLFVLAASQHEIECVADILFVAQANFEQLVADGERDRTESSGKMGWLRVSSGIERV